MEIFFNTIKEKKWKTLSTYPTSPVLKTTSPDIDFFLPKE